MIFFTCCGHFLVKKVTLGNLIDPDELPTWKNKKEIKWERITPFVARRNIKILY